MYLETKNTDDTTKEKSTPIPVWNEFASYHDYLVDLLSYGRKHNLTGNSVWEFEYV